MYLQKEEELCLTHLCLIKDTNKQTNLTDDLLPLFSDPAVMRSPPPGTKNPTGRQIIREITLRRWKWQ